jgi:hypothetical protein
MHQQGHTGQEWDFKKISENRIFFEVRVRRGLGIHRLQYGVASE